jgi:hypothetical protein
VPVSGYGDLLALSARLKQMGTDGQGLRRELLKSINDAAVPLAREIQSFQHLAPYMPDRYAAVLAADVEVVAVKRFTSEPSVRIRCKGREKKRKVVHLNDGFINHPVYAQGERKTWRWSNDQTGGMKAGFFYDAAEKAAPEIKDRVLAAMAETARKITGP